MEDIKSIVNRMVKLSDERQEPKNFDIKEFQNFAKEFYAKNSGVDFSNYFPDEFYGAALLSFDSLIQKKPGEYKVSVTTPRRGESSFNSHKTFIDIINDDMPFLVDSIVAFLDSHDVKISNIIHPIYTVKRDKNGKLISVLKDGSNEEGARRESVMQLHLDRISSDENIEYLREEISKIIENANIVVADWQEMLKVSQEAHDQVVDTNILKNSSYETKEIKEFISWVNDGHFIFLGAKQFDVKESKEHKYMLEEVKGSELGVFRSQHEEFQPKVANTSFAEVTDSVENPFVIEILKSRYKSYIHRLGNAERIRIQKISQEGKVIGEYRFVGLFTSGVYNHSAISIPLISNKISKAIEDSNFIPRSHDYKDLVSILESYPRDELFQISQEDLNRISGGIVSICGRSLVKFFARHDKFERFVSCLVYMPKGRSNSDLRDKIRDYLSEIYEGTISESFIQVTESKLVRLHVIIRTESGIPKVDEQQIQRDINKITKVWQDDFKEVVRARYESENRGYLYEKYQDAFSVSYINKFDARRASIDASIIETCIEKNSILFYLHKSDNFSENNLSELKIYNPEKELVLSDIMPILESFGFNIIAEYTYEVNPAHDSKVYVHYFNLNLCKYSNFFSARTKVNFEKLITLISKGLAEVSPLNKLVVDVELGWKHVCMLTAYAKYLHQVGFRYSETSIAEVLANHKEITGLLADLFETKFNPELLVPMEQRTKMVADIEKKINKKLSSVTDIISDTVIKRIFNAISSTLRTNYFQTIEENEELRSFAGYKGYISFKFDCSKVIDLPLPNPHAEIFVYSARVEAIHLRGGKVARGGLRWSDRHEDFRTEVLGLMKAQMTKNAVIVPVGSKGGFIAKKVTQAMSREEVQSEGVECYKTFLRGILDITDNVVSGKIVHASCVSYDQEDPYLVVAADKGTATFSDIANSISAEYNFWLGDAFASGGSVGYDHKKMGITAKGAWVSVQRHFREIGVDTQSQDFTCVGVGDMGGDVFGNGMLLSKHIRLVAAFNHMHIFLDPNPDAASSFKERSRMFKLPRSSWLDYNQDLISKGGGVFERSAKSIKISQEVQVALGIEDSELSPKDLIVAILKSPVDLLWNGGIGTYVKGSIESNQDVGDRANDDVRINGSDLRCKVIGEGGNLGLTQRGRIEFASNNGLINTDSIDNSAGVDCSDHEVNIKIALTQAVRSGKIDIEERNKILESMTDEIADLVLNDNRLQTQTVSTTLHQAKSVNNSTIGDQAQLIEKLENAGLLNREIEFLPSKKEIERRQLNKTGFTKPELSVMLAYSKMEVYQKIINSKLVKDKYFVADLYNYFPKAMHDKFSYEIEKHQLRDEIIATQITNFIIDRTGITFVNQLCHDSGFVMVDVIRAIIIACESFKLKEIWSEIEALDGKVSFDIQSRMFLTSNKLLERSVIWILRNTSKSKTDITKNVDRFANIADRLSKVLTKVMAKASQESFQRKVERYCLNEVPKKLASKVAGLDPLASTFDIAEISEKAKFEIEAIAKIYFAVGTRFSLKWLRSKIASLSHENQWQRISSKTILEDLYAYQMRIANSIVTHSCNGKDVCDINAIDSWTENYDFLMQRYDNFISDLKSNPHPDISVFVVALNRLKPLVIN